MSLLAVQGGATGTGTVTLLAPVTNTDRTLTLPDVTDTVAGIAATQTLTNKTLTSPTLTTPNINSAQFATVSGTAPIYGCRAWIYVSAPATPTVGASGNITSFTRASAGNYTLTFTTAMPDANYAVTVGYQNSAWGQTFIYAQTGLKTTTAIAFQGGTGAGDQDPTSISVAIFR